MAGTYVTDLRHFLHVDGELADTPSQARQLASFLALIVDAITLEAPENFDDTQLRCRVKGCKGPFWHAWMRRVRKSSGAAPAAGTMV